MAKASAKNTPRQNEQENAASLSMTDIEVRITTMGAGSYANQASDEGKQRPTQRARCNINIGGAIALRGIRLMQSAETGNLYLAMPGRVYNERWLEHFFPVDASYRQQLTGAVMQEYQLQLGQAMEHSQGAQGYAEAPDPFAGQEQDDMAMAGM